MTRHAARPSYLRADAPPLNFVRPGGWRERAACRRHPQLPPQTWDDSLGAEGESRESADGRAKRVAKAIAVCNTECPVKAFCLATVDLRYDEGVRGGIDLRRLREVAS